MSIHSAKAAKRRVATGALILSLLATPSLGLVASATTIVGPAPVEEKSAEPLFTVATVGYSTIVIEDEDLPADTEVIESEGVAGTKHVYTMPVFVSDGEALQREIVVTEPQDRVIRKGTAIEVPVAVEAPKPVVEEKPQEEAASRAESASESELIYEEEAQEETVYYDVSTSAEYSLGDLMFNGVINWGGYKFTYYSQSVLPGGGLAIPGRHVNGGGYVADSDGYIVLAAPYGVSHGTVFATPFGYSGKVYDTCASCSTSPMWLDVYTQ